MARRETTRALTPTQAARAVTIDFEGLTDHRPVLLGSLWIEGRGTDPARIVFRHDHLEKPFRSLAGVADLAGYHRYESQRSNLERAIGALVDRAERQRRLIIGWSHHEVQIVREYLPTALADKFESLYRDAKATARRWTTARIQTGQRHRSSERHTLVQYMDTFGMARPVDGRIGGTADRIRRVERGLATRRAWKLLLPSQQEARLGSCTTTQPTARAPARSRSSAPVRSKPMPVRHRGAARLVRRRPRALRRRPRPKGTSGPAEGARSQSLPHRSLSLHQRR